MDLPSIHIYSYFILLLLYATSGTVGYIIIGNVNLKPNRTYLNGAAYSLLGCLTVIAAIAVWRANGVTYQLPLLALPLVVFLYRVRKHVYDLTFSRWFNVIFKSQPYSYFLLTCVYVIVSWMFLPFSTRWLQVNNLDFGYYAYQSRHVYQSGLEGVTWGMILNPTTRSLYHFTDAWLCGIISAVSGLLHYHIYVLVVKSFVTALIAIAVFDVIPLRLAIEKTIVSLTVLFVGTSLFFIDVDEASHRWAVDFYPSIINYHGGLFAVMYIAVIAVLIFNQDMYLLGYLLLAVGGAVHTMLLPVAIAFFPARIVCEIIWGRLYRQRLNLSSFKHLIFFVLLASFTIWWSFSITQSNTVSTLGFNPSTVFKTAILATLRSWFEVIVISIFSFAGLIYLAVLKWKESWQWAIDYILLATISTGIYSILFDSEQGNSWQVKIIVITPLLFVMGYVGITYLIRDWHKMSRYFVLSAFAILFFILSYVQPNYFFGPGPITKWNDKRTLRIEQTEIYKLNAAVSGRGPGAAILREDYSPILLSMPAAIDVSEACGFQFPMYRINLVAGDTANAFKKGSLSHFINYKYPVYLPNDSSTLNQLISDYSIQWIYTDRRSYIFPNFLKEEFPVSHVFSDIIIHTRK